MCLLAKLSPGAQPNDFLTFRSPMYIMQVNVILPSLKRVLLMACAQGNSALRIIYIDAFLISGSKHLAL